MTTLDLKMQMKQNNKGRTIIPTRRPLHRTSRPTQFSSLVRGNKQLTNKQGWDEINRVLFV